MRATLCILLLAGCATDSDPESAPSAFASALAPADATLVLDLVNHPDTDVVTMDEVIGLDARAARNIAEHRAGSDGVFPSLHDDFFDDIDELDAIPYVGDVAFEKLVNYARANPVRTAETVEGVTFQGWQVEAVLHGVNTATFAMLDGMMDERAANNLIAARPLTSMAQVGAVSYVGVVVLERLQDQSSYWWNELTGAGSSPLAGTFDGVSFDQATAEIALDIANRASKEEMVAAGMPSTGSAAIVANRPYTSLAGVAAVSGVGTATMTGLKNFAQSGTWSPSTSPSNECVFGLRWPDLFDGGPTIIVARRVLDPASSTNATQRTQLVAAVQHAYPTVTTVTQAFAAVDESQINHVELWDASNRRAYTAYEYGAGDNSYGAIFAFGGTTIAARITDGDLYDCTALWGNEMRDCVQPDDCATGLTCQGMNPDVMSGRCIDVAATEHTSLGASCVVETGCPAGSGLVCGAGTCVPAWMKNTFDSGLSGDTINQVTGLDVVVPVWGLATVDAGVVIDLIVSTPRPNDLRVHLINPAGTDVLVFNGTGATGSELALRGHRVTGFSGDEAVNGNWTIRVTDVGTGTTAMLYKASLTITSRWD